MGRIHSKYRGKQRHQVNMSIAAVLTVEEGLALINDVLENYRGDDKKLFVNGERVKRDFERFEVLKSCALYCYRCGLVATHFTVERAKNNHAWPYSLNVYSNSSMLTWDHILPKSFDGSDDPANARCACARCNSSRGQKMTLKEMIWAATGNPLQIYKTIPKSKSSAMDVVWMARKEFQQLGA